MSFDKPILGADGLRLGYGCAGAWAKPWFSEREAERLVATAIESCIVHFDTGASYANGEAERRLGSALAALGQPEVFISTKTGTRYDRFGRPAKDFSEISIRADVEGSLRRLGRERLDLLYLHGPGIDQFDQASGILARLKEEGKIAMAGSCSVGAELEYVVRNGAVDAVMATYNLFCRDYAPSFAEAKRRGISVVAIAPLGQALYRRDLFAPKRLADLWHLARALKNNRVLGAAIKARRILENIDGWTPAEAALSFTLANPDIDLAVMASTRPDHIASNAAAARRVLPPSALAKLKEVEQTRAKRAARKNLK